MLETPRTGRATEFDEVLGLGSLTFTTVMKSR
jgi:hypothetical protein